MSLDNKIRVNLKLLSPKLTSRSRSRLPHKSIESLPLERDLDQHYRDRSQERSIDKIQKSDLYKKNNTSLQDLPLLNSSFNNKINLPEHKEEQDSRGRQRDRAENKDENADDKLESQDDDMISLMGFGGFGSTKGKHVKGTKGGSAKKETKSEYRKYMNRSKGFNRPLSPSR